MYTMRYRVYMIFAFSLSRVILGSNGEEANGRNIPFTQNDIDIVVSLHDQVRALNMTPVASDMVTMSWDQDLMEFAVDWTSNCLYVTKDNTTTDLWPEAGQNFFIAAAEWSDDFHYSSVLRWLRQKELFNYEDGGSCSDFCGEFLQIAYSKTYKIGCAATFCPILETATREIYEDATLYMCAYYPKAPREPGYRPYQAGSKCTNCSEPKDTCTDFKLCTNPDRQMSLRDRKKRDVEEKEKAEREAEEAANKGWSLMEIIISAVTGGIGLLAAIGAVIKLCKGSAVSPSDPAVNQSAQEEPAQQPPAADEEAPPPAPEPEETIKNGKAPTLPVEPPEN